MKEDVDGSKRQGCTGDTAQAVGKFSFGDAIAACRRELELAAIRPNAKACRATRLKLLHRAWENVDSLHVTTLHLKMWRMAESL